jgi:hypothetical protein
MEVVANANGKKKTFSEVGSLTAYADWYVFGYAPP